MSDRIETMRTAFHAAGHEVDAVGFARAMLAVRQRAVSREFAEVGIVPSAAIEIARTELGDPTSPRRDRPVAARVNAGRWIADCECGGAEYVDDQVRVFMCAACFNRADGSVWRRVIFPASPARRAIEAVLLARPDAVTRHWDVSMRVRDLERENAEHGLPARAEVA